MARPRHVLQLVESRWEQVLEHVLSLARYLPRQQFDVTVAGDFDRVFQELLGRMALRWVKLDASGRRGQVAQLQRLAASASVDLIHSHGLKVGATAARAFGSSEDRPALIYTAHELSGFESGAFSLSRVGLAGYRRMLSRMDAVIALSQRDRQALGALAPQAVARVEVVPPGVDTRRVRHLTDPGHKKRGLGLGLNSAIVGVVADLERHTGVEDFLHAAAEVSDALPNVEFAVLGDGPRQREYELLAHRLKLSGALAFLGRRHDLPEVLATLNVLVVTTEAGGGVQTALQALSLDIPVVAVSTGGLTEVLEGIDDVALVPRGHVEAMAEAMRQALERVPDGRPRGPGLVTSSGLALTEQEMLVSMEVFDLDRPGMSREERGLATGSAGQALARQYSIGRMVRRTVHLYQHVLSEDEAGSAGKAEDAGDGGADEVGEEDVRADEHDE